MQFEPKLHAAGRRLTVFVIEGEEVVRSALSYILRDRYRVHAFISTDEAHISADKPDVVLIGVSILQDRSETLLPELIARFGGAKILIVADRTSDPLAQACLGGGAHGVVSKPISFDPVCDAVRSVLAAPIAQGGPSRLIRMAFG